MKQPIAPGPGTLLVRAAVYLRIGVPELNRDVSLESKGINSNRSNRIRVYAHSFLNFTVCTPDIAFTNVDFPWATWPIVPMLIVACLLMT